MKERCSQKNYLLMEEEAGEILNKYNIDKGDLAREIERKFKTDQSIQIVGFDEESGDISYRTGSGTSSKLNIKKLAKFAQAYEKKRK